jgi:hypothetical protein
MENNNMIFDMEGMKEVIIKSSEEYKDDIKSRGELERANTLIQQAKKTPPGVRDLVCELLGVKLCLIYQNCSELIKTEMLPVFENYMILVLFKQ